MEFTCKPYPYVRSALETAGTSFLRPQKQVKHTLKKSYSGLEVGNVLYPAHAETSKVRNYSNVACQQSMETPA